MNAYITLRAHRHGTGHVSHYELIVTVAHNAYNTVGLSPDEAARLLNAGVPVTHD